MAKKVYLFLFIDGLSMALEGPDWIEKLGAWHGVEVKSGREVMIYPRAVLAIHNFDSMEEYLNHRDGPLGNKGSGGIVH